MVVAVNGSGSNGFFAAAITAYDGMVVAVSTAAAQLTTRLPLPMPPLAKDAIVANAIVSLSLHPTAPSNNNRHQ